MALRQIILYSLCAGVWLNVESRATRSTRDAFEFPADEDGIKRVATRTTPRALVASNNNNPPQFPILPTTADDPWADMTPNMSPTEDPWADMFPQRRQDQYTTTRTTNNEAIYFYDREDPPYSTRRTMAERPRLPVRIRVTSPSPPTTRERTARPRVPVRSRATTPSPPTTSEGEATTEEQPCDCQATTEFNPVCGQVANQKVTFPNMGVLKCANLCGTERIELLFHNSCRQTINVILPLATMRRTRSKMV